MDDDVNIPSNMVSFSNKSMNKANSVLKRVRKSIEKYLEDKSRHENSNSLTSLRNSIHTLTPTVFATPVRLKNKLQPILLEKSSLKQCTKPKEKTLKKRNSKTKFDFVENSLRTTNYSIRHSQIY